MAEIIFNYEGVNTTIQCNENDKVKDIINKFLIKIQKQDDNLYFLYNGTKINYELTFNEQANKLDKNRKIMNVLVIDDKDKNVKNDIISKEIICPECKDNIFIDIKNFKINLYGCKQNHNKNNIILYSFEETQKIDLNKIKCEICNNNNKGNTHNNDFYKCITCNKNICPLCKSIHDENHIIINYDNKNYICDQHNEAFNKYCEDCKENICFFLRKKA